MSWSASGTVDKPAGARPVVTAEVHLQQGYGEAESEFSEDRAESAVVAIVGSGALGDGLFNISLSGHSNPGGTPQPGWANDCLTISIYKQS